MLYWLRTGIVFFLFFISGLRIDAQLVDFHSSFSTIAGKKYLRIHYDNDFFTNTDHYYTQGITLEYATPSLKKADLNKWLFQLNDSNSKQGISFHLFGYTPTSIASDAILYGDRPFEGSMSLQLFSVSHTPKRNMRLVSSLSLGVIGPAALGEDIQTNIHRWTGNKLPKGWQHQVKNDIIVNYQLNVEKRIYSTRSLLLHGIAEVRAGTLNNKLAAGINFMTGHFDDPFVREQKKRTSYFLFGQAQVNAIGYDATMQGGLFNRKSPYVIPASDISRLTFQVNAGIGVRFNRLYFSYHQAYITKEFRTGQDHRWGGLTGALAF